ncbi:uncharacterized protein LOC100853391 isoform X3 [Vitis vinifera]|uniref:uncharacterized protein LOC100853391 isoform X3 n=1 Tax=Vitis vinifera TaxID=29760 RepID=UPI0008FFCC77|nr:uncharacterized protein LOC100853391 isoform X3 [Vitis vinifera]|eukprot:XP_019077945.1 PREDICTED: uncharacterized protein LOC100853391 isoform X3 [Vitis vinifera]
MEEANPDHSSKAPISSFLQQRNEEPPVSSSLEQRDKELGLCVIQNEATDCTRVICDVDGNGAGPDHGHISHESSLAVHPFPWENIRGRYQAYSHGNLGTSMNLMTNSTQYNSFLNPQVRSKSINSGGMSFLHRPVSAFPCPEGDMNRLYQSYTHDNRAIAENLMDGATHFNNFQSPQIDQNFLTGKVNAAGGFQMNREGGEACTGDEYRSQISRDFVNLAGSNPGLYHTPGNRELGIGNSSMVGAVNSNFQEHMDGSFLTLGIGGNREAGYKSIVYGNEINDQSERLVFPQLNASHGQKTNITSSNPVHNMAGSFSSLQNNVGGFSSLGHNIGGRTSSNNDLGGSVFPQLNISFGQTTNRSSLNPVHNVDDHFSSWQNDVGEFLNPTHNMGVWASSNNDFGAMCGTNAEHHFPSLCHTLQTPQVDGQQYLPMPNNRNLGLGVNIDPQSANIDPYGFQGYPASATRPISSSQVGVLDFGLPSLSELLAESAKTKRIIAQPTPDQLQERYMNLRNFSPGPSMASPSVWGIEGTTRQEQSGNLGRTQDRCPVQSTKDLLGPAFTAGQGITVAKGNGLPSRDHHGHPLADGQVIPVAQGNVLSQTTNVFDAPSRKRSAVQTPQAAPYVPRRKTRPQPSIRPSIPFPAPMPRPSISPSIPLRARLPQPSTNPFVPSSAAPHVKWQGFDGSPELSGLKCLICKRDVSYAPEGHIFQPAIPPAVAVLPCGHIFHDHCLQLITPKDQSKDPPCIPCAIGET